MIVYIFDSAKVNFPLIVCATPLLVIFHGMPMSRFKEFYFKFSRGGNVRFKNLVRL